MFNFYYWPYCLYKQPINSIFKIEIDSDLSCCKCKRKITPVLKPIIVKFWHKMYKIGVALPPLLSFFYYFIFNDFGISILYSIITCALALIIYLLYIYFSTKFSKSN